MAIILDESDELSEAEYIQAAEEELRVLRAEILKLQTHYYRRRMVLNAHKARVMPDAFIVRFDLVEVE